MRFSQVLGLVLTGALLLLGAGPSSASPGDTITRAGWWTPLGVVVGADGTAYIGDLSGKGVSVVPAGASEPSRILSTNLLTNGLGLSGDGTLYLEGTDPDTRQEQIGVIPKGGDGVTRTIPVSQGAHLIAVASDGTVYVPNYGSGTVSVIPPGADTIAREIAVGAGPREVAIARDGTAYVTNQVAGTVSVIPASAGRVSRTIQVSSAPGRTDNPHGIAVGPDGTVYVTDITANEVAVIRPGGTAVAYRVPVRYPKEVAVASDGTAYVLSTAQNLSVIRPGGRAIARSAAVSASPGHLAVTPKGSVLVTNPEDQTVSVLGPELLQPIAPTASGNPSATPQAQAVGSSPQTQSNGGNSRPGDGMPVILGTSALVLLAAAGTVIAVARRRRRPAAHGTLATAPDRTA
ncbi:beta-propeller fold lactonase family protein [Sinomonas humi]|uniref:beta-propeller fold lactonase family protein n=1 Tax=Sinomonas humi TaxID=1338436 RepID=UPI00068C6D1D|nr:beta-propeller fold lactonase family protein [Sinomonas humi]